MTEKYTYLCVISVAVQALFSRKVWNFLGFSLVASWMAAHLVRVFGYLPLILPSLRDFLAIINLGPHAAPFLFWQQERQVCLFGPCLVF